VDFLVSRFVGAPAGIGKRLDARLPNGVGDLTEGGCTKRLWE